MPDLQPGASKAIDARIVKAPGQARGDQPMETAQTDRRLVTYGAGPDRRPSEVKAEKNRVLSNRKAQCRGVDDISRMLKLIIEHHAWQNEQRLSGAWQ